MKNLCGVCYRETKDNSFFHESCSRKLFGTKIPPLLPYSKKDIEHLAQNVIKESIVVPGVQTKLSLGVERLVGGSGKLTIVGVLGAFILKPPVPEYPYMPEIEDLSMHLASIAGIGTVPHGLIKMKDESLAYITRRIDRPWVGKGENCHTRKRHMEDMCQLSEKMTEQKYMGSMERVSKLIRKFSSNSGYDITRFFDMSLFSFLIGNGDMHLKNFSILYRDDGSITLSPAYDQISTRLLIPESKDPEEMALTINGKKAKLKRSDFEIFGKTCGLGEKQVLNLINNMGKKIPAMLSFVDRSFLPLNIKKEFKDLIQKRSKRLFY